MATDETNSDPSKRKSDRVVSDEEAPQIGVSSNMRALRGRWTKSATVSSNSVNEKGKSKKSELDDNALHQRGRPKRPSTAELVPPKKRHVTRELRNAFGEGVGALRRPLLPVPEAQAIEETRRAPNTANCTDTEAQEGEEVGENDMGSGSKEVVSLPRHMDKDGESTHVTIFPDESSCILGPFHGPVIRTVSKTGGASAEIVNIDGTESNALTCAVYSSEIYSYLRAIEHIRRPLPHFLESLQSGITQRMRAALIDWLVEVCDKYHLAPDVLYLTACLVDKFLSKSKIEREKLQFLGITCMVIAAKYEEPRHFRMERFWFFNNRLHRAEVLKMEKEVLSSVDYSISAPTVMTFLRRFLLAAVASSKTTRAFVPLTHYLAELTLIEYRFIAHVPSLIAASAVFLALWTLDQTSHPWNETLQHYTGYKSSDVMSCVLALQEMHLNTENCTFKAIRRKYNQEKFAFVACLTSPKLPESLFF